jgi:hypothetical protein
LAFSVPQMVVHVRLMFIVKNICFQFTQARSRDRAIVVRTKIQTRLDFETVKWAKFKSYVESVFDSI